MNEHNGVFRLGSRVTLLPVVHGSADFAWQVRHYMMANQFDCLAVPLPKSFQASVEQAILKLPFPSIVVQRETVQPIEGLTETEPAHDDSMPFEDLDGELDEPNVGLNFAEQNELDDDHFDEFRTEFSDSEDSIEFVEESQANYVPIDPCQPVIAAIRFAMEERIPCRFIDLETSVFEPYAELMPDAYALKKVSIAQFGAAVLPSLAPPDELQWRQRIAAMAYNLRELCIDFQNVLCVCSILDWPWIRQAFNDRNLASPQNDPVEPTEPFSVDANSLYFLLSELPFITGLYEQARATLLNDEHLAIDGVKELLISARTAYTQDYRQRARKITPHLLRTCLKYIRNLTLIDGRFTPELITVVTAAKQMAGDGYALHVLQTAKSYPFVEEFAEPEPLLKMGIDQGRFPNGDVMHMKNRLLGAPKVWSNLQLVPKPDQQKRDEWKQRWNPNSQCSWPPEDELIENFRAAVVDKAQKLLGHEQAKTEKFTTSFKDGIDIRDTLRHWYEGSIYVKEIPANRGTLDAVVMLFDSPADPRDYPWRTTWFAEHKNESTLAFFATRFEDELVGPGICLSNYGGAMFLFPPLVIPDIWLDPRLAFTTTLEEKLLAAACLHSQQPRIALLSSRPPGPAWKQLANQYRKTWIHVPLAQFGDSTIQSLRCVHVLNGKEVRSYAADFIRKS
ncbi:MAG TPA: hypothetical protein PKD64_13715 [Pirellulaceae bacterium]|nr:hypothetical protein [Pirellulaceae bacterium]HMO93243.1 hypothetical protein [Pirellulaceae bacterium]HMP69108.1 hypothetical protein [Pirellulaceae bacterium]